MSAHFTTKGGGGGEQEGESSGGAGVEGGRVYCGRLPDKLSRVAVDMWLWQQITNELSPFVTTFRALPSISDYFPFGFACQIEVCQGGGREAGDCHGLGTS